jgi:hypothetical protein
MKFMDKLINYQKPAEARLFALLLTFSGGFIDAFTYIKCGRPKPVISFFLALRSQTTISLAWLIG